MEYIIKKKIRTQPDFILLFLIAFLKIRIIIPLLHTFRKRQFDSRHSIQIIPVHKMLNHFLS